MLAARLPTCRLELSANVVLPTFSRAKPTSNVPLFVLSDSRTSHHRRPLTVYSGHSASNSCLTFVVVFRVCMMHLSACRFHVDNTGWPARMAGSFAAMPRGRLPTWRVPSVASRTIVFTPTYLSFHPRVAFRGPNTVPECRPRSSGPFVHPSIALCPRAPLLSCRAESLIRLGRTRLLCLEMEDCAVPLRDKQQ